MFNESGIDNAELNRRAEELELEKDKDFVALKNQYQSKIEKL